MKKRVFGLLLAAVLLAGGRAPAVRAEEYAGDAGWEVAFTGEKMESSFQTPELSDAASALQPGDRITFQIALRNGDSGDTDWYMSNEVLSSLEDSQRVAQGGSYTYVLSYRDKAGQERVLYSSENVGGEGKTIPEQEGLHEATDSLEEFFYLDSLKAGEEGLVTLKVCLDGETQGNAYQDTLAKLQMNFAVEKASAGRGGRTPGGSAERPEEGQGRNAETVRHGEERLYTTGGVRTGDETPVLIWLFAALCSGLGLVFAAVGLQKREKGGKECEERI